jgi:hypothetical protein
MRPGDEAEPSGYSGNFAAQKTVAFTILTVRTAQQGMVAPAVTDRAAACLKRMRGPGPIAPKAGVGRACATRAMYTRPFDCR